MKKFKLKHKKKILISLLLLIFAGFVSLFFIFLKDLPRPEVFTEAQINQSTKIYDRTGKILLSSIYGEEKRTYIPLAQIPDIMQKAIIATEDSNFYKHFGIDIPAMFRAIKIDIINRTDSHGASTITQQLIRSTFLTPDKTISRKIKEIILSIELDRKYSKDQILEWYLNQVPFGINIYGLEEASLTYFQKSAQDLTLPEAALMAAIVQLPSYYSPYGKHLDDLLARKDYVLKRMEQEHYITAEQRDEAMKVELTFNKLPKTMAVHFVEYVKQQIEEKYGPEFLETKGLKIDRKSVV